MKWFTVRYGAVIDLWNETFDGGNVTWNCGSMYTMVIVSVTCLSKTHYVLLRTEGNVRSDGRTDGRTKVIVNTHASKRNLQHISVCGCLLCINS